MAMSMKDLRYRTRQVMASLKRGEEPIITYRGSPFARIVSLTAADKKAFREIGFGMWKNRVDLEDVSQWLTEQRKPRHDR